MKLQKKKIKIKKRKKSLPLISRNLSIDVTVSKKISQISRPRSIERGIRGKQIAKSPARDRCSATPSTRRLIVSNSVSGVARRNGR